jgi:hypothetical protein
VHLPDRIGRRRLRRWARLVASIDALEPLKPLAHTNKSLAQMNKSGDGVSATK